jgi:hypothetical protein
MKIKIQITITEKSELFKNFDFEDRTCGQIKNTLMSIDKTTLDNYTNTFLVSQKEYDLMHDIINDINLALLNTHHDVEFIRGFCENIVRGVKFKIEWLEY